MVFDLKRYLNRLIAFCLSLLDVVYPRKAHWVFLVGPKRLWNGDHRMLYECVKKDSDVDAVILGATQGVVFSPQDRVYSCKSIVGLRLLLSARVVVIHHGLSDAPYRLSGRNRLVCNTWHGIPIKGVSFMDMRCADPVSEGRLAKAWAITALVPASSKLHSLALSACFRKNANCIKVTGLPRNDLMLLSSSNLPSCYQQEEAKLEELLDGRKLILYAPTFNDSGVPSFDISGRHARLLEEWLTGSDYVFGVRRHVNEQAVSSDEFSSRVVNIGNSVVANAEIVLRRAELLVTDGSGIWLQFILKDKPMVWLGDGGECAERGLMFDTGVLFPGDRLGTIDALIRHLDVYVGEARPLDMSDDERYQLVKRLIHQFDDAHSTRRLIEAIKRELPERVTAWRGL